MSKDGIYVLLALYLLLGSVYSVVTPVMEASDELWHYPMVQYIADHGSLPVQDPERVGPWRQEGSQPPLYYFLGAALTAWIDTSDLFQVRTPNPHADNGIITEDGNTNLIVHGPADRFPWQGATLAIHLIRFVSVCMGAGTVYFTYCLALELWPERVGMALAAAAITAFTPMFCFISGSVNNDNLTMLLCAAGIWMLVRWVKRHGGDEPLSRSRWWRDAIVLGTVLGLGVLTKSSAMGLLPLTALAVGYVSWRRRSWWYLGSGGGVMAGLVAAIAGWWFVRNAILYDGDWMGIERFIVILGYRDPPATLRQLWGERQGFMMAYWGLFGGVNVPMAGWIYTALNGALLAAAAGLVIGGARGIANRKSQIANRKSQGAGGNRQLLTFNFQPSTFNFSLLFLWPVAVVIPWAVWATKTWSSQGRLVFSAISAWSTWISFGLSELVPRRWSSWVPGALSAFLFGVAAWAPWGVIAPAYRPPVLPEGVQPSPAHALRADLGGQVRLLGYDMESVSPAGVASARPGEAFRFTLYWEAQREMDRDWSIFCHILDLDLELPIATRDRYPGQGLLATRTMEPGLRWADRYVVWLPETAYAPSDAVLEVGLYDAANGERPLVTIEAGSDVQVVENGLRFQPLHIEPRPGDLPNPVRINFQDRMALVGWDIDRRAAAAGDVLHLTTYWECLASMEEAYTVSSQVLDERGRKAAQADIWPGDTDTSHWEVGQQIVDRRDLAIDPGSPAGSYELVLRVYGWETPETLKRLRIIDAEGRVLPNDFVVLGRVRIVDE